MKTGNHVVHECNHRRDSYPPVKVQSRSVTESNVGKIAVAFQKQTHKRVFWFRHVRVRAQQQEKDCG